MTFNFTLLEYFIVFVTAIAVLSMFDLIKTAIKEGMEK
jgi:hypothetical protein